MSSSLSIWRRHIENQRESGHSIEEYCRQNKLKSHMFHYYRKKFFGPAKASRSAFVPAIISERPKPGGVVRIIFDSGMRIEISEGVDSEKLLAVVNLLKRSA